MMRPRTAPLALLLFALVACGGPRPAPPAATTEGPPRRGGEATAATIADLSGVNELTATGTAFTSDVLSQLFLGLLRERADYQEHPPTYAPELAESWEFSPDRQTLTLHLRADAFWSDGVPITAEDVRFSWQAQTSPDVAWAYADSKSAIRDVEVVDARTVRVHYHQVYAFQLVDTIDGRILPRHLWSQVPFSEWRSRGDWFRENLAVSGPFRLAEWRPGQEIVLERNERYPERELPRLDRVRFRVVPDQTAQVEQLLAGALDFLQTVPPNEAPRLATDPRIELLVYPARQYDYICWNTARAPFDDARVRRALTLAIDRQSLVDILWKGYAQVAAGPIPSDVWARDPDLAPWPYDPAAARRLLAEAGFADRDGDGVLERDGEPFRFELLTNSSNRLRSDALVLIQEQLRRIGVEAVPRALEIHTLTAANFEHDFDATLSGWAVDTTLDLRTYFHSASIEDGYNFGSYRDPEIDRLVDLARRVEKVEDGAPLLRQVQQILHRDQPYTFLWEPRKVSAARRPLVVVEPNALSTYYNLSSWWLRSLPGGP